MFVHGGLLPHHVQIGFDAINAETALWMDRSEPIARKMPSYLRGREALVWSRHFSQAQNCQCDLLAEVLAMTNMSRMVVGHTIQEGGITSACDQKVFRVDVGLSKGCGDGPLEVLQILNDKDVTVYPKEWGSLGAALAESCIIV